MYPAFASDVHQRALLVRHHLQDAPPDVTLQRLPERPRRCFEGEARHLQSRYEDHNRRAEHAGRLTQGGTEGQGRRLQRAHGRADLKLRRDSTSMPGTPVDFKPRSH